MNRAVNTFFFHFPLSKLLLTSVAIILIGSILNIPVIRFNISFNTSVYFDTDFSSFSFRV